jgi:hypothetical protein
MKQRGARVFTRLALAVAVLSCGQVDPSASPATEEAEGANAVSTLDRTIGSDTLITLERTACFGSCPVYSLSITGDGAVAYLGESYVNVKGTAEKQVASDSVQALVDQMLEADYFNLSVPVDCSRGFATDAAGATTSLALDGRMHTVHNYYGNACAPASLRALEDAIDAAAESAPWVECANRSGVCCDRELNPLLRCD